MISFSHSQRLWMLQMQQCNTTDRLADSNNKEPKIIIVMWEWKTAVFGLFVGCYIIMLNNKDCG